MKQSNLKPFFIFFLLFSTVNLSSDIQRPPISPTSEEIEEVVASISPIAHDLLTIKNHSTTLRAGIENLDCLCERIARGQKTAPMQIIDSAVQEAALVLLPENNTLSRDEITRLASNLEAYYEKFKAGVFDVAQPETRKINASSRTFRNLDVLQVLSSQSLNVSQNSTLTGNVNVGGNHTVNKNSFVHGDQKINGNLNVTGSISSSGGSSTFVINGGQTGPVTIGTKDATELTFMSNNTKALSIDASGVTTVSGTFTIDSLTTPGVVHNNASGNLSTSLIVDADVSTTAHIQDTKLATIVTTNKVADSANASLTNATSNNTINTIVKRDGLGGFSAETITADLMGDVTGNLFGNATTATTATTATNFTGPLSGDITGTQGATVTSFVGGQAAANVASATVLANAATSTDTPSSLVLRDSNGDFSTNMITIDGTTMFDTDVATKAYVDFAVSTGIVIHPPVKLVSVLSTDVTSSPPSGLPAGGIDGVAVANGDRILLTAQTNAVDNGAWVASSTTWGRPTDFPADSPAGRAYFLVQQGDTYAGSAWLCATPEAIVSDTGSGDDLIFNEFSAPSPITGANLGAGAGVFANKTGVTLNFYSLGVAAGSTNYLSITGPSSNELIFTANASSSTSSNNLIARDINGDFSAGVGTFTKVIATPNGATITGTTNINNSGSAVTTIGTGGTGAVNIGNTTGNTAVTGSLTASTGLTTTAGGLTVSAGGASISGTTGITGATTINNSGSLATNIGTGTYSGTLTLGNALSTTDILGTTNINNSGSAITTIGTGGTGAVNIGNTTGNTAVTGSLTASTGLIATTGGLTATAGGLTVSAGGASITGTTGITGATTINNSGSLATNIGTGTYSGTLTFGNALSTTDILGTTNINNTGAAVTTIGTGGSGAVNIGNTTGNTAVTGSLTASAGLTATTGGLTATAGGLTISAGGASISGTTGITGATTINNSGSTATNIGTGTYSGTLTLGNASSTTNILGTTNINASGSATTAIGTGGTGAVNIGNTTGNTAVTGSLTASTGLTATTGGLTATAGGASITGATTINNSGSLATNIGTGTYSGTLILGNALSTTDILGTTNINNSGSAITTIGTGGTGAVNIGNATGNTAVTGSLTASTGLTATTGGLTATAGGLTVSAGGANITGTTGITGATTITGTTNINNSGAATTTIGTGGTGAVNIGNTTGNTAVTGSLTASTGLTATTGGLTATAGGLTVSAGGANITGTTTLSSLTAGLMNTNSSGAVSSTATTNHAIQLGNASSTLSSLAVGATGTLLAGNTGADPAFTASPSVTGTITAGTGLVATTGGITATAGGLTVSAGGASITGTTGITGATTITGTTNINNSGNADTTIGTGGTGAVNIGNATGNTTFTGTAIYPSGSVSTPSLTFSGSTSTGLYSPGTNQVALAANSAQRAVIDSTSSFSYGSKYKMHAYRSTTQNINATTATIVFDTVLFDSNSNYVNTTGVYTVPVTGIYLVNAFVNASTPTLLGSGSVTLSLQKNGSGSITGYTQQNFMDAATNIYAVSTAGFVSLTQNDTLQVRCTTSANTNITANQAYLSIHFMSF